MSTIKEVALQAGVSVATVSRYLNSPSIVSTETVEKISSAIRSLNYHPNRLARGLRTTRSRFILVLLPSIENSFLSHVVRGIQSVGGGLGYSVLIGITGNGRETERSFLELLSTRGVDGIVAVPPANEIKMLRELSVECPLIQCSEYATREIPFVTIDNRAAVREMVRRVVSERGCKAPALISGNAEILSFREREQGFRDGLRDCGLDADAAPVVRVPLGFSAGKKAASILLGRSQPDYVAAVADILALGAIRHFLDTGYSVPGDLCVTGVDGISLSREFRPSLSTVIQPGFEIGKKAARLIIDRIEGRGIPQETLLPYRIVMRQSTGGASDQNS